LINLLWHLAMAYFHLHRYSDAEPLLCRVLAISEQLLGKQHERYGRALGQYAALLRHMKRNREAKDVEKRAKEILARSQRSAWLRCTVDVTGLVRKK
jgi:hypothetical protein